MFNSQLNDQFSTANKIIFECNMDFIFVNRIYLNGNTPTHTHMHKHTHTHTHIQQFKWKEK